MQLKNIGPDDRHIPSLGVQIPQGKTIDVGDAKGQVPEPIAREFANDDPARWKIIEDKKKDSGPAAPASNP